MNEHFQLLSNYIIKQLNTKCINFFNDGGILPVRENVPQCPRAHVVMCERCDWIRGHVDYMWTATDHLISQK